MDFMTLKEKFELMKARGKNAILYFDMDGVLEVCTAG